MKAKQSGFTLLELMLAIALIALVLGIGVPNFRDFVRNSRMAASANDIVTDFNLARSEAVKRRVAVTLCKSQNLAACDADDTDPFDRWIVFVDDADPAVIAANDGNGTVDAGEVVLRQRTLADSINVLTPADQIRATFLASGFPRAGAANVNRFLLCDSRGNATTVDGNSAARAVQILPTGRPTAFRTMATVTIFESALGNCP